MNPVEGYTIMGTNDMIRLYKSKRDGRRELPAKAGLVRHNSHRLVLSGTDT